MKGHWSFLHEWVIYDYLLARSFEGTLRLRRIISGGALAGKPKWVKVEELQPILGTNFPDVQAMLLKGNLSSRPAEVKFRTSLFNYHKEELYKSKFQDFRKKNGFILVVSHDYLPGQLILSFPKIDVFEIELDDFITFCRENFSRLLNRQIKSHTSTRVWLMYQGPNFNEESINAPAARKSCIWCPTENLTGFDLAAGDRILFFKTFGISRQDLQKEFHQKNSVSKKWWLREICVAEVSSKIFSRSEFTQLKKYSYTKRLWANDPQKGPDWRWDRVFEFNVIKVITKKELISNLGTNSNFAIKALEAFCYGKSREMGLRDYRNLLETLV